MAFIKFIVISLLLVVAGCVGTSLQTEKQKTGINLAVAKSPLAIGLSPKELSLASKAEIDALEKGPVGLPVTWTAGENRSGSVTPGQSFSIGSAICRRYKRTMLVQGQMQSESATACKGDDGIWSPLD